MSNTTQKKILVVAQTEEGKAARLTYELLDAAAGLAAKSQGSIHTVMIGADIGEAAEELSKYTNVLYAVENPSLILFHAERYLQVLANFCKELLPDIVLMIHNIDNIDVAPGLAFELESSLITDCVGLDVDNDTGSLLCTKEVYGGNGNAVFSHDGQPAIATVRPKGLREIELGELGGEIKRIEPEIDDSRIHIQVVEKISTSAEDFSKADVVVAGGRGIGGPEGVTHLEELVAAFKESFENVALGGSRPAIDEGWLPSFSQVGLTGEKVNPQIYVAVGISGALQHVSGVFGSK
jgi:electron transfer flavoprotein alpha subunit